MIVAREEFVLAVELAVQTLHHNNLPRISVMLYMCNANGHQLGKTIHFLVSRIRGKMFTCAGNIDGASFFEA